MQDAASQGLEITAKKIRSYDALQDGISVAGRALRKRTLIDELASNKPQDLAPVRSPKRTWGRPMVIIEHKANMFRKEAVQLNNKLALLVW